MEGGIGTREGRWEEKDKPVEKEENLPALHHGALDVRESVSEDTTDDLVDTVRGAVEGKDDHGVSLKRGGLRRSCSRTYYQRPTICVCSTR